MTYTVISDLLGDLPCRLPGCSTPSLRAVPEDEKETRKKTRFSRLVNFVFLPTEDSDCDLLGSEEDDDTAQNVKESRIAELNNDTAPDDNGTGNSEGDDNSDEELPPDDDYDGDGNCLVPNKRKGQTKITKGKAQEERQMMNRVRGKEEAKA